jgi:hypothetical protein
LSRFMTGDENWIYGHDPETKQQSSKWKSPNKPRLKKARQVTSRWFITENSSWHASQSVMHTTVTFYGNCMKMCESFAPNFGNKGIDCYLMTTHHLTHPFSPRNFLLKQHDCRPHTPYLLDFAPSVLISVTLIEDNAILTQLRWSRQFTGRAEHPHRTWFPGCI